jgi:hypothetical protein
VKTVNIFGIIIVIGGIALLVICLLADLLGLGDKNIFGYKQILGVIAGAVISVVGIVLLFKR